MPQADGARLLPELPGILTGDQVRTTVAWIAGEQSPDGALPWFRGGQLDPWDSVEAAMALDLGGEHDRARAAYRWLAGRQRPDGSWAAEYRDGAEVSPDVESNHAGYLAVGLWHRWLVLADEELVAELWPAVRRGLDLVVAMQLDGGTIGWALRPDRTPDRLALLTGNASLFQSLRCGIALAGLVGEPQPDWELAVTDLGTALRSRPDAFADRSRYSMDWYYPILGGAVTGEQARDRLAADWDRFVVPGLGARCVSDRPWVTGAETCELALALVVAGQRDAALEQVAAMQHLRDDDGSYWTGYVFADDARWPIERTTWTAAAVLLAADALSGATPACGLFADPAALPSAGTLDDGARAAGWLAGGAGTVHPVTASRPPAPADPADVTVVVASRNRREDLLVSLPRHEAPVVLVDNASTDGTVAAVRAAHPEVTVLPLPRNLGARARTMGAATAGTPFVAFSDDDSWWAPGDLARAVAIMRAHPRLAVLNARILVGPEERLDPVCAELARSPLRRDDLPGPALLGFVACAALVRTEAFEAVGGFDAVVRFPGEEERLALDLATAGWSMAYVDSVTVHHHPSRRRDAPGRREAGIWRSRLLTAAMRLPAPDVAGVVGDAVRSGRPGLTGLARALPDLPAALRGRRPIPERVRADLRLLAGEPG